MIVLGYLKEYFFTIYDHVYLKQLYILHDFKDLESWCMIPFDHERKENTMPSSNMSCKRVQLNSNAQ